MNRTPQELIDNTKSHFDAQIEIINQFTSQTIEGILHVVELCANKKAQEFWDGVSKYSSLEMESLVNGKASDMKDVIDFIQERYDCLNAQSTLSLELIARHCRHGAAQILAMSRHHPVHLAEQKTLADDDGVSVKDVVDPSD